MSSGAVYIAYGDNARGEAAMSIRALRSRFPLPITVISDRALPGVQTQVFDDPRNGARWAKLNLEQLSPYDCTLYLDADTRPRGDLTRLFVPLEAGFELVIAPSTEQADRALWHVSEQEREATFEALGFTPVQLQAGVMAFRKCEAINALFEAWRAEWRGEQDQAALLRALYRVPVRTWLMSSHMSDALVLHLFGRAKAQ